MKMYLSPTHRLAACGPLPLVLLLLTVMAILSAQVQAQDLPTPAEAVAQLELPERPLIVHFHDPEAQYETVGLWAWDATGMRTPAEEEAELFPVARTDFGVIFVLDLDLYGLPNAPQELGLLPRYQKNWDLKDGTDRRWKDYFGGEIFMIRGDQQLYSERPDLSPRLMHAYLDADDLIVLQLNSPVDVSSVRPEALRVFSDEGREFHVFTIHSNTHEGNTRWLRAHVSEALPFQRETIRVSLQGFNGVAELIPRLVLACPMRFYDADAVLGATCTPESTTFRVFAPSARQAFVVLYPAATGAEGRREIAMERAAKGIWEVTVNEDLHGLYYMLRFEGPGYDARTEAVDVYTFATSGRDGRGQVVDMRRTDPPGFLARRRPPMPGNENSIIVWEIHVRDFSIHPKSGIDAKGKYTGFTEHGTFLEGYPDIKTGIDHILELGITHVQLLPIQDFDNNEFSEDYNWGYMPSFFNSPDGWYASNVRDLSRITEFKKLVQALHEAGIRVVMDVVYNHTDNSVPFERMVPGYYYRMTPDGRYSNGSGTGNEFHSETPMGRKFIVDSCRFWVEEYGIDGFRFDLMALVDLETMIAVREAVQEVDPTVVVWGEPWMAGGAMVRVPSDHHNIRGTGLAAFNDQIRNLIKGGTRGTDGGFVQHGGGADALQAQIAGAWQAQALEPTEPLHYVEAHDDLTLWDKLIISAPSASEEVRIKMQEMAGAILLTSVGKVFLHAGQEFLRSKNGVENSYNAPDEINQLDWTWKQKHFATFEYHRGLIDIRRNHPVFHMMVRDEIAQRLRFEGHRPTHKSLAYTFDGRGVPGETWDFIRVIHNADTIDHTFHLPAGEWNVVAHNGVAGLDTLQTATGSLLVPAHRSAILWRNE